MGDSSAGAKCELTQALPYSFCVHAPHLLEHNSSFFTPHVPNLLLQETGTDLFSFFFPSVIIGKGSN